MYKIYRIQQRQKRRLLLEDEQTIKYLVGKIFTNRDNFSSCIQMYLYRYELLLEISYVISYNSMPASPPPPFTIQSLMTAIRAQYKTHGGLLYISL